MRPRMGCRIPLILTIVYNVLLLYLLDRQGESCHRQAAATVAIV